MKFGPNCGVGLLAIVLLSGNMSASEGSTQDSQITVLVNNSAGVPASILKGAEREAARIFRAAGIGLVWVDCSKEIGDLDHRCRTAPGTNEFILHIVPGGKTSSDFVFGLAFLGQNGDGKYSDIFYDRVLEAHRQSGMDVANLVGTVAAHELGHLLLGSNAHSYAGIMTAVWRGETLERVEMGSLLFTGDQASRMRARMHPEDVRLFRVGTGAGK
jgi:hypothetical protein